MRPLDIVPTTDAEVFDLIHGAFGIGDYDPDDDRPWHKFRMVEISKIKAIRTKRRWTFDDFAMVARYCKSHRIRVLRAWDLLEHYSKARLEQRALARARPDERVEMAVAAERIAALPDSQEWISRLQLSAGKGREAVLEAWAEARERTFAP